MKSFIKIIISMLLLLFAVFCLCKWLGKKDINIVVEQYDQCILYGSEKCYIIGDYVYIINSEDAVVHIFDIQGIFLKTIYIPRNGGDIWWGTSENKLYVYSVRCHLQINIIKDMYVLVENTQYINSDDFIKHNNIVNIKSCKLINDKIIWENNDGLFEITLDAKVVNRIPRDLYALFFALCIMGFMIISGIFRQMLTQET